MDCLFCKFANGEIPVNKVYEDENMIIIFLAKGENSYENQIVRRFINIFNVCVFM